METSKKVVPYVRVLGYSEKGKELMSEMMQANPKLNMVTSVKKSLEDMQIKLQEDYHMKMMIIQVKSLLVLEQKFCWIQENQIEENWQILFIKVKKKEKI